MVTFLLVLYSTFLTRSGILGETSVHAFTDLGMNGQLLFFMFIFLVPSLLLFFSRYRSIPTRKDEEQTYSREFWMFVGSLVLALASVHITFFTSVPVWNKLFGLNLAPPIDAVRFYNQVHIWFAIVILILSAAVLFLNFKKTNQKKFWKSLLITFAISVVLALIISLTQKITGLNYILMAWATSFGIVANVYYLIKYNKKNLIKGAAGFTHWGFAIMLLGILISSYNKKVISLNKAGIDLNMGAETPEQNQKENGENLLLFRQLPTDMGDYILTYLSDSLVQPNTYYKIQFERFGDDMKKKESFILQPYVQFNPQMGGILSNPDTKHYLTKDVYTYITKAVDKSQESSSKDSLDEHIKELGLGDTAFFSNGYAVLKSMNRIQENGNIGLRSQVNIYTLRGDSMEAKPYFMIEGNNMIKPIDTISELDLYVNIEEVLVEENKLSIKFSQNSQASEFVVIKSIQFPYINLVWLGALLMTLGFGLSVRKRLGKLKAA